MLDRDSHPVQYLGYCTVCNTSNSSHPFNPMTPYFDTSSGHASNPCAHSRFQFSFPFLNFIKLSLLFLNTSELYPSLSLTLHSLNPDYASTTLSTSTLALCLSLNLVVIASHIPNSGLEAKTKKKRRLTI